MASIEGRNWEVDVHRRGFVHVFPRKNVMDVGKSELNFWWWTRLFWDWRVRWWWMMT